MTPSTDMSAIKMAGDYMMRQHLRMKWFTILISGSMATYTIQTNTWILEMGFFSWIGVMGIFFVSQWHINKLFIEHAKHMQKGNEHPLPMLMKAISQHAWIQWGVGLIAWYWIFTLGYINFFTEIPPVP